MGEPFGPDRNTEAALRKQIALLESVLDCLSEGVVVCDTAGKFLIFNRTAEQIVGIGATAADSEQWPETYGVFLPDTVTPFPAAELPLVRAANGEETTEVEQFLRNPNRPEGVFVSVSGRPLRDAGGALVGGVVVVRDVTEHKRADKELRIAKDAAEAANRVKSEFLARMSHEIRTPMNGVMGMLDLALRNGLDGHLRELVDTAHSSAGALLRLLDDILDLSRMEAGRLELENVAFSLRETVGDVVKLLSPPGHEKGLALLHHVQPGVPDAWLGDPVRLSQVLVNLISNAIKFTARGRVAVRVEREGPQEQDGKTRLSFAVADSGMGIPAEKLQAIFEAFAQADTSTTRRFGGSGLGLAIASRLVEQMDGRIEVESEVDLGSTFRFTVRLAAAEDGLLPARTAGSASAALETAARPLRILVAEDNAINQRLVRAILGQRGHEIAITTNGREALAALERESFDVVLMDMQMPEMDGFQTTGAIREREAATGAHIPIVAMTAHAFKEDRDRCLAAGMDGYIAKPIRFEELVELVENAPSLSRPAAASPLDGIGARRELTALFVEDAAKIGGKIHDAVARGDGPALQDAAHRLRGTAGYFGAVRTLELTARLEQLGRAADFTAETARLSQLLGEEIARLERELPNE